MRNHLSILVTLGLLAAACSTSKSSPSNDAGGGKSTAPVPVASTTSASVSIAPPTAAEAALVANRPYLLRPPAQAEASKPLPLIVLLHGYGATASWFDDKTKMKESADQERFVAAIPDGTPDSKGKRFWNATDACCNFDKKDVDDAAYLRALIKDASARAPVDPKRIYIVGYDNGGFLAHRAACELSDIVAGVVSVGGAGWLDPTRCTTKGPVSILQVHGDNDQTVAYGGGRVKWMADAPEHPGARQTVADWAKRNGCGPNTSPMPSVNLDDDLAGAETIVERYNGCERGAVELWTRRAKKHQIGTGLKAMHLYTEFLLSHPKR